MSDDFLTNLPDRVSSMWEDIGEIPQIKRGLVFCHSCGRQQSVNGVRCMQKGWPECCGYTMSLDSPEEREAQKAND